MQKLTGIMVGSKLLYAMKWALFKAAVIQGMQRVGPT